MEALVLRAATFCLLPCRADVRQDANVCDGGAGRKELRAASGWWMGLSGRCGPTRWSWYSQASRSLHLREEHHGRVVSIAINRGSQAPKYLALDMMWLSRPELFQSIGGCSGPPASLSEHKQALEMFGGITQGRRQKREARWQAKYVSSQALSSPILCMYCV